jgi:drug/metabolite transporter (DMT)-like permease
LGVLWGLTQPLSKLSVSEGYRSFGLVFWQLAITGAVLGSACALRRRPVPLGAPYLRLYALIALIGTVLPNSASYQAAVHLPSGILSIVLSLVPMFAFPIALALGIDRFSPRRLLGLCLCLSGVALIALPEASLPERALVAFLPLALVAPALYALEGNVVARWGTLDLDPVQLLAGASAAGLVLALPLALATGQFIDPRPPWGVPDAALLLNGLVHAMAYAGYVWLVGRTGAVFAAQVSYLVTGFGVIWAMLLLGERYGPTVWAAMGVMFLGLFLVVPRRRSALAPAPTRGQG